LVYGRGSADMKGACAAAAEAVRVFAESPFKGEVVIVAIGLHEAPDGRGEDLKHLLENGFRADMAVVCELSGHDVAVAHMGHATVEITVFRPGTPTHELQTAKGTPHPLHAAARVIEAISARNEELSAVEHPWVGAETYFVGEVHGGDFYNRFPTACRIVGTRRWAPSNTLDAVTTEYLDLLDGVAAETGCNIALELKLVRGAYEIDPEHPLVQALQASYRDVTGNELEPVGIKLVADGALFAAAGIPTVYHGPVGRGAHADVEFMAVDELVRAAEVYVALLKRLL
jgi:acetylornithine deacetylase